MLNYLYCLNDLILFSLISFSCLGLCVIGVFITKSIIPFSLRHSENPVIGNVSSLIALIYGVLAGLTALYLINNISYTNDAVQREANATANLYRDSTILQNPYKTQIQNEIKKYLNEAISIEWPTMKIGAIVNQHGNTYIDTMHSILNQYNPTQENLLFNKHDMLDEVKTLYNARQLRIAMSTSELSSEIWVVILLGTILTISINFLFAMNYYLHLLTIGAASLMASSMIFLLITLDRPYQGEFAVLPTPLEAVLQTIK
ncbi:MAG: DUF4239 domain-containing protein [Gammaproteobacteria bacterium]|nr:DUF4239 domain-containing protein [Gammaproteobacteria bacterium]